MAVVPLQSFPGATVNANAQVDTAALPAESGSDTFSYAKSE
ncbi:MAG: hypothetical protein ACE362_26680 [Phaeodactylibacter xiamenensis]|nr:hypothetical protein [bacterium]